LISVCWEWRSSRNAAIAQNQVNTDRRHDDRHEMVPQSTMRGRRRPENVTKLAGSGPQHSMRHR
jgi:hypothetical protein